MATSKDNDRNLSSQSLTNSATDGQNLLNTSTTNT
ncbi:unnamed protein product, partial [Rotaria sp. Silwood1]